MALDLITGYGLESPPGQHDGITLEPYVLPRTSKGRSNQNKNLNDKQKFENEFGTKNYIRYFTITATSGENLAEIDVIKGNEDLERYLNGSPNKITELRSGQLLIEVRNEQQSKDIHKIGKLANCKVTVAPHDRLNQSKGTIYYENKPNYSDEDLLKSLKKSKVIDLYRIKKKIDGKSINTPIYILTFQQTQIPEHISVGWTRCRVRDYIPRPRRCFKCQRFGHGAKTCRAKDEICVQCGKIKNEDHQNPCQSIPSCINCSEEHQASSPKCIYYIKEFEVLTIQAKQKLRYAEAKQIVDDKFIRNNTTYASIAVNNRNDNSNNLLTNYPIAEKPKESEIDSRNKNEDHNNNLPMKNINSEKVKVNENTRKRVLSDPSHPPSRKTPAIQAITPNKDTHHKDHNKQNIPVISNSDTSRKGARAKERQHK